MKQDHTPTPDHNAGAPDAERRATTPLRLLAEVTEQVRSTSGRKAKTELLADLFRNLGEEEIEPAVGFVIAQPRQGAIGVGWAMVAALPNAVDDPPTDSEPASSEPTHSEPTDSEPTDSEPTDSEPAGEPVLITDLDRLLDGIAATTGTGSRERRRAMLTEFVKRCDAPTASFVKRVLVGEARQGALAGVVTDAVAKAAGVELALMRRAAMLQGDLGCTAVVALTSGEAGLTAVDLVVHRPIQPMLASTAADVTEAVAEIGTASVEWKLDGARIQVHMSRTDHQQPTIAVYTRNLNPVTDRLASVIAVIEQLDCRSAVLDGEVLGFFGDDDQPQAFQDTMSTFGTRHHSTDARQPATDPETGGGLRPSFFDLMYLDGRSLIDEPLSERIARLHDLLDRSGVSHCAIPQVETADPSVAAQHLEEALAAGHEGVMVKAVNSTYEAGRRGKTWRKVKPVHTLDLIVLGAEWGHGRRQGWLSNLHLGARHPETGEFVMVGKTFKGLTDELLRWQTERFQQIIRYDAMGAAEAMEDRHGVLIEPIVVVEIAVDGAQTSRRYPGGVALRFARVRRYRDDKDPSEVDTLDAVRALL